MLVAVKYSLLSLATSDHSNSVHHHTLPCFFGNERSSKLISNMGREWGQLAKIRRVVYFRLSPHEQKPFVGMISHGIPNIIRRMREQVFRVVPPFIGGYLLYAWAIEENDRLSRKNPKDYENDV